MCGVFGYIATRGERVSIHRLMAIAAATETRGRDAWGLAWIDGRGRMRTFKQTGPITDSLSMLSMAADARLLIGHCRWATHGDPDDNRNNHPHRAGSGWIVHNGVIANYRSLIAWHGLDPQTDCDSEVLGLLFDQARGDVAERSAAAVACVPEYSPLVLLGLWTSPRRLVAIRKGNPLHVAQVREGRYLASLPLNMPGRPVAIADRSIVVYGAHRGQITITTRPLERQRVFGFSRIDGAPVFVEDEGESEFDWLAEE